MTARCCRQVLQAKRPGIILESLEELPEQQVVLHLTGSSTKPLEYRGGPLSHDDQECVFTVQARYGAILDVEVTPTTRRDEDRHAPRPLRMSNPIDNRNCESWVLLLSWAWAINNEFSWPLYEVVDSSMS